MVGMLFSSAAANPQECDGSVRPPETQVPAVQTDTREQKAQTDTVPAVQKDVRVPEVQNQGPSDPGSEKGFNPQPDPPGQPASRGEL